MVSMTKCPTFREAAERALGAPDPEKTIAIVRTDDGVVVVTDTKNVPETLAAILRRNRVFRDWIGVARGQ